MKQQVFFIHGGEAYTDYKDYLTWLRTTPVEPFTPPSQRWYRSLPEDLEETHEVFLPQMPNKHNAKYLEWEIWFERHFEFLRDGVILIGWSQGAWFLARYVAENELPFTVRALILLAAPHGLIDSPDGEDGGDFLFDTDIVPSIQEKVEKIVLMHSKDDFVVPYEHTLKYYEKLPKAELITFEDKNHFLQPEFPELVAKIKALSS